MALEDEGQEKTCGCQPDEDFRSSRLAFCVATFLFSASLHIFVPILPIYAESLVHSLALVGLVVSSYSLPQLLLRIPVGLWYDAAAKKKPIIMLSVAMGVAGALGLTAAGSLEALVFARAMTGVAAAGWVAFTTLFTRYYPPEQSARAIGMINAINQIATLAATGSGGVLADAGGYKLVFMIAAALAALGLLALTLAREPSAPSGHRPAVGFSTVVTNRLLIAGTIMAALMQFATFSSIFGFIPSYGASIGASNSQLGVITMVTLAASAAAGVASVRVAERLGYASAISLSAALLGGSLLLVPLTTTPEALAIAQVVGGAGRGSLATLLMALSIRSAPAGCRATAMGVYQALYSIGSFVGPVVSGVLADQLNLDAVFQLSAVLTLGIIAVAQQTIVRRA